MTRISRTALKAAARPAIPLTLEALREALDVDPPSPDVAAADMAETLLVLEREATAAPVGEIRGNPPKRRHAK